MGENAKTEIILPKNCPKNYMGFSCKIKIKDDYTRRDGNCHLYLQCYIEGNQVRVPLRIYIEPQQFDKKAQRVKGKSQLVNDYNLILQNSKSRANSIFIKYRLMDVGLTVDVFRNEFNDPASRLDFLKFYKKELDNRVGELEPSSLRQHKTTLVKLRDFKGSVLFNEITVDFLKDFDKWLKVNLKNGPNTRGHAFKNIKTYLNIAKRKGINIKYPFNDFKVRQFRGERTCLSKIEIEELIEMYNAGRLNHRLQNVLQYFLFSVFTGLRISDVQRIKRDMILDDTLVFMPKKTKNQQKIVKIPLSSIAKSMINGSADELFYTISDQKTNDYLKEIAKKAGIKKNLTFHVARYTFATLFLELGGNVEVLQCLMGHSKIETTMIYVRIVDQRKKEQIKVFDVFSH